MRRLNVATLAPAALAAALGMAGCAAGPSFHRPAPPTVAVYATDDAPADTAVPKASGAAPAFVWGEPVPALWWHALAGTALDATMATALSGNPSLAVAVGNLRATEDQRRAGVGLFLPDIGVGGNASRQRAVAVSGGELTRSTVFNLFTVTGSVGYVLDLFGGARRHYEALGAEVDSANAATRAAYLGLTANVLDTTIARAAYAAQLAAADAEIVAARDVAALSEVAVAAGTQPFAAVLAARTSLAGLIDTRAALAQHYDAASHLLVALAGRNPGDWEPPDIAFETFSVPATLPVALPSELVRRRPDILAAEARLHVAGASVGEATAALLPSVTIVGTEGAEATAAAKLGDTAGRTWTAGAGINIPVFQGGALWYARRAAVDAYNAALADYRQTVLTAFTQVADSLRAVGHDAESAAAAVAAEAAARDAMAISEANYAAGLADYATLLRARQALDSARIARLGAVAQQLQDVVALYVALGGDWQGATAAIAGHPR